MDEPFELRGSRLVLRPFQRDEAAAMSAYRSLPEVARLQSWSSFTPDDAAALITSQERVEPGTPGTWLQLAIVLAASGELVGDCGVHFLEDGSQVELGITLAPGAQGGGLAAEALESVMRYAFDTFGKHRVMAVTDADNLAAARLFRRLGFRQEAHFVEHVWFKGGWGSEYLFAMLRREWLLRQPS